MSVTHLNGPTAPGHRKLRAEDLYSLEQYATQRTQFRPQVISHKKQRTLQVGPNATFSFEDRLTVQYQVQEMLRIERIFEPDGIAEELAAYNPLIPDGSNLKATLMVEYDDVEQRRVALQQLRGIEHAITLQAGDAAGIAPIADEDLERSNESKTSAVHFLRFELPPASIIALRDGAPLRFAVAHAHYTAELTVEGASRDALLADFD
jgi:hypothetical protein